VLEGRWLGSIVANGGRGGVGAGKQTEVPERTVMPRRRPRGFGLVAGRCLQAANERRVKSRRFRADHPVVLPFRSALEIRGFGCFSPVSSRRGELEAALIGRPSNPGGEVSSCRLRIFCQGEHTASELVTNLGLITCSFG